MKSPLINKPKPSVVDSEVFQLDKKRMEVQLPDGRVLKILPRPRKQKQKTGPSARITTDSYTRIRFMVENPDGYRNFDHMTMGTNEKGGSPGIYPRQLYSLMFGLQNALAQKTMCQNLRFPENIKILKKNLLDALPHVQPDDQVRIQNWVKNPRIPSPSRINRMFSDIESRGVDVEEIFSRQAIQLVLESGRLSRDHDVYAESNYLVGDGTVLKSASSRPAMEYIDIETGEIRERRTDLGSLIHTEGGGETVYGTKYAFVWSTGENAHDTIAMGAVHVASNAPGIEAKCAIDLVEKIQIALADRGECASLLAYDRAATGQQQEKLNGIGMVLATRAFMDTAEGSDSHYRKPKYIGHVTAPCGHEQRFAAILKRLHHEVTDVSGKTTHKPLEHKLRPKRRGDRIFHYSEHSYVCWCSPSSPQMLRISWNGRKAALSSSKNGIVLADDKGYENMLRYLQPHAPDSEEFKVILGKRQTSESMHSIIDGLLPFKRLQRWNLKTKRTWIYAYLIGHNLVYQQLRRPGAIDQLIG